MVKIYLGFECDQFEYHLHSKDCGEHHVQDVHHVVKRLRLPVVLHVEKDMTGCDKTRVLSFPSAFAPQTLKGD